MYVKTEFVGSGQNSSELHVIAGIEVSFPSLCGGILRINTVELRERALPVIDYYDEDKEEQEEIELHPRNEELGEELRKNSLRFSFHDGHIDEVCPEDIEPAWALNLKKGILSTMQNTMRRFDVDYNTTETDVSGTCDVSYMLMGTTGTSLLIQKHKDISSCTSRYKTNSILQTTPYNFRQVRNFAQSKMQKCKYVYFQNYAAWPVLTSNSFCNVSQTTFESVIALFHISFFQISVDHYVYNNVSCHEKHLLIPFSNNQTGAATESRISLTLADEETGDKSSFDDGKSFAESFYTGFIMSFPTIDTEPIVKRSSLLFDHSPTQHQPHGEIKSSRDLLKQMCEIGFPNIEREFPDVFVKFLTTTRLLSHTALQQLLARASSICGSGKYVECVGYMVIIINMINRMCREEYNSLYQEQLID
jgi:hypothetical protein